MDEICRYIDKELYELEDKVAAGGKLSGAEVEYGDKLAHFQKSLLTNEAMKNRYSEEGRSYDDYDGNMSTARNYRGGRSYRDGGMSYARGRGRNAKRDSMGRYSRDTGYSYDDAKADMVDQIKDIMQDAPDEQTKKEFQRFVNKLESM